MDLLNLSYAYSLAVVGSTITTLIWVWFWTRGSNLNAKHGVLMFLGGALAIPIAIILQLGIERLLLNEYITASLNAFIEEVLKLGVILSAFVYLRSDRNKAVIYMIVIGLGYVMLENILFIAGPLISNDFASAIKVGISRPVGPILLHVIASAMVGWSLWYTQNRTTIKQIFIIGSTLLFASILHAFFNLEVTSEDGTIYAFIIIWLITIALIYVIFRESRKAFLKKLGTFILIVILFISVGIYLDTKVPKYNSGVIASWEETLIGVEKTLSSFTDENGKNTQAYSSLSGIYKELESIILVMKENQNLSAEQLNFLENYNKYIDEYNCILREEEARRSIDVCLS